MKNDSLELLYLMQAGFQRRILEIEGVNSPLLPIDDSVRFHYHTTALVEEMGEILKADKRWKTHRNSTYDREEKLDEYADLFITVLNIGLYSGFSIDDIKESVTNKIATNNIRLDSEKEKRK